jgi:hypothetical protein
VRLASSKANGPDMIDCEALMRAIQSLHGGTVVLTLFAQGTGGGTGLNVNLTHICDELPQGATSEIVGVSSVWPCALHRDFWACVFEGLYKLDYAVGQAYKQQRLPEC